jgi:hypothetical protein
VQVITAPPSAPTIDDTPVPTPLPQHEITPAGVSAPGFYPDPFASRRLAPGDAAAAPPQCVKR